MTDTKADERNKATSRAGTQQPAPGAVAPEEAEELSKKEQREGLKTANEATNITKPTGTTKMDDFGNNVQVFEDETEGERALRVNHRADRYPYEEMDETKKRLDREQRASAKEGNS